MNKKRTIVLEDLNLLSNICGAHDLNLNVIEDLLGAKVFSRGNELFLESEDKQKIEIFKSLIDNMKIHLKEEQTISQDLIRAIYNSLQSGDDDAINYFKKVHTFIPNGTKVFPRSYRQAQYIRGMEKYDIVFSIGPAGTGKTFLAVAYALKEILESKKKKLVLTRPVVEAGENLGFLPGDLSQKINPYLRPLYDAMDSLISVETINRLEANRIIEIAPLAYMRGRTLTDSYIILDEAQNTTREQMKMFLTRLGERSKAVITGDVTQIDLPNKKNSGLFHAIKILKSIKDIHFTNFDTQDVVRNPLIKKIVYAYENEEK